VLASGATLDVEDLDRELSGHSPFVTEIPEAVALTGITPARDDAASGPRAEASSEAVLPLDAQLRAAEKSAIEHALRVAAGNRTKAARLLGVSRQTLYNKLKEHGLASAAER
jgi:two-component system response regulator AtoC